MARSKKQNTQWEVGKLSLLSAAIHWRRHRDRGSGICILAKKNTINYIKYPKTSSKEVNKHFGKSFIVFFEGPPSLQNNKEKITVNLKLGVSSNDSSFIFFIFELQIKS